MAVLIGVVLAVALLFLWLCGHWFGRVLAFLAMGAGFGIVGFVALSSGRGGAVGFLGFLLGLGLAWLLASVPTWLQRRRAAPAVMPTDLVRRLAIHGR